LFHSGATSLKGDVQSVSICTYRVSVYGMAEDCDNVFRLLPQLSSHQ